MSLNLTIDQGNTAAKLALWDGDRAVALRIEPQLGVAQVERFVRQRGTLGSAIYCSVASKGTELLEGISHLVPRVYRLSLIHI